MSDELSRVCELFGAARLRVIVVSAYLGASTLERILDSVPDSVTRRAVYARWDIRDLASGATDWRTWDVAKERGVTLCACPRLHAKIYVSDDEALVGSANATASGLGYGVVGNLELLLDVPTSQRDVSRVLASVEKESSEALPLGADTASQDSADDGVLPFWLPNVGPDGFLGAVQGERAHTEETLQICSALGVPEEYRDDVWLRRAVRDTTLFRFIEHEFESRPTPMTVETLRHLLSEKVDRRLGQLTIERLIPLVQWLGHFGANTHAVTSSGDKTVMLHPGARLASYDVGD